jgi:hypothetical protein
MTFGTPSFIKNHVKGILLGVYFLLVSISFCSAQDEEDAETDYETEFNYGINFNTNGGLIGGVSLKYAKERKPGWYNRFQLEIVNLKHPKEYRLAGVISSYIANKYKYLLAIRPSFGQEFALFKKAPEEGVQLNVVFGAGPTLGITKPYYILYTDDPLENITYSRRYEPSLAQSQILGVGRLTDGMNELGFVPGFHFRGGLAFESGRVRSSVFGLEGGFVTEFYSQPVELLKFNQTSSSGETVRNPSSFFGLYLILYYGSKR